MFFIIGALGVALLILAFVLDDVLDALVPQTDWLSTSAIAAFLTAFGFGAALLQWRAGLTEGPAALGGTLIGVVLAAVAVRWSRALSTMATDGTPTANDLIGCAGRVLTPVLPGAAGEVMVHLGGQPVKLSAVGPVDNPSSDGAVEPAFERGTDIVVVAVLSPTRVRVESAESFWS